MKILFSSLLSSNSLLLLFIVVERFMNNTFSQKNKYFILKVALLFSIIPLGGLKTLISIAINYYFPSLSSSLDISISGRLQTLVITPTRYFINSSYRNNLLLLVVWLSTTFVVFLLCLRRQYLFKKRILNTMRESSDFDMLNILNKYIQLLKINKNIRIYITDMEVSPFTIGLLNPIIIMPDIPDLYKKELIILHELYHIKSHDSIIKFFQVIAVGIYWFNPLIYLLDSYLNKVCELACDESVTNMLSKEDKIKYAYLIVDLASFHESYTNTYISPFSNSKNIIKERINSIMKNNTKSRLAIFITVGMVVFSTIPALAYQDPEILLFEQQPTKESLPLSSNDKVSFKVSKMYNTTVPQPIICDEQFTDVNGQIYEISPSENSARKKCEHTFVDGVYEKHTKNKDGSCKLKAWDSKRCSKCGAFVQGSLISETKYTKCPH